VVESGGGDVHNNGTFGAGTIRALLGGAQRAKKFDDERYQFNSKAFDLLIDRGGKTRLVYIYIILFYFIS
jgi:hypothetical protein